MDLQNVFAERIGGQNYGRSTEIYKFEKIKRAKAAAKAAHPDVELIDMGVGEPDAMAFPEIVEVLRAEAGKPENRGYTDNGVGVFKEAAARYMQRVFGVEIDPASEVNHAIGGKSALSLLPTCFINPGDIALMTTPGYPVFGTHAKYYGGSVVNLPISAENQFLPDLDKLNDEQRKRAKTLVLNYPNNPTGATATRAFFERAVEFARRHEIVLIHDAAYAGLMYDGNKPLSLLSVPGAKDIALEVHSLSKSYNMTGWRIGFVCGNRKLVQAFADVKDNSDSGQFAPIQKAAAYGLDHPEITGQIAAKYSRRMDQLVPILNRHGFAARKPGGSFFLYVRAPRAAVAPGGTAREFSSAEAVSAYLIEQQLISTVPWDDCGPYLRWSVTFVAPTPNDETRVLGEIDRRLSALQLVF